MKKYLSGAALIILSILFLCFQNLAAFAVWSDESTAGEPDYSYVEPVPDPEPGDSSTVPEPEPEPEPTPSSDYTPDPGSSDYVPNDPSSSAPDGGNDNWGGGGVSDNYSFYDEPSSYSDSGNGYDPGSDSGSNVVSSVDNDLYDVSKTVDSNEMNSSDWKIALDLDKEQGGSNDFNFIKNNKSADDENSNQWMLFLGIGLIAAALAGIIGTIVYCTNKAKKNKSTKGRGGKNPPAQAKQPDEPQTHVYQPKKSKMQKYDTAEIDIDLGDERPKH